MKLLEELLEKATESRQAEPRQAQAQETIVQQRTHFGPLPDKDTFVGYEEVVPGSAKAIVDLHIASEKQRIASEKSADWRAFSEDLRAWAGWLSGFVIALLTIGGSIYLIATGMAWGGTALGIGGLASLVWVFVYGTRTRSKLMAEGDRESVRRIRAEIIEMKQSLRSLSQEDDRSRIQAHDEAQSLEDHSADALDGEPD